MKKKILFTDILLYNTGKNVLNDLITYAAKSCFYRIAFQAFWTWASLKKIACGSLDLGLSYVLHYFHRAQYAVAGELLLPLAGFGPYIRF